MSATGGGRQIDTSDPNLRGQYSNTVRRSPDCRMTERSVPHPDLGVIRNRHGHRSSAERLCMITWLPRWRTRVKPCWARRAQICLPENVLSLPDRYLKTRHEHLGVQAGLDL